MNKENRVNIINFIRGVEPRRSIDLVEPVREQIRLVQQNGLAATWLLQYDALMDDQFTELLKKELNDSQEIGAWFEVVQPMVEKAGLEWRGRFPWDWHANVGFSVGYLPEERERLADVYMSDFYRMFGYYPKSVGSWLMDAYLLGYLADRYGVNAACNCKDQWGTDGYTLWGGYYNQAFYPSRKNSFMPAQNKENQIPIPVFRMLGSDPIYQYDMDMNAGHDAVQGVITLEPTCKGVGGGEPEWVKWFFDVNFNEPTLSFGYTQIGQENSFGWNQMKDGLTDQIQQLAVYQERGDVLVETLDQSGTWFKNRYDVTPASSVAALTDWKKEGHKSIWYYNRNFRMNLFWEQDQFWIRDLHRFDESYEERYLKDACVGSNCWYDTLPILDGARWSDLLCKAGIRPIRVLQDGTTSGLTGGVPEILMRNDEELIVNVSLHEEGMLTVRCLLNEIIFHCDVPRWRLEMSWSETKSVPLTGIGNQSLDFEYNGFPYRILCSKGSIMKENQLSNKLCFVPERNTLVISVK